MDNFCNESVDSVLEEKIRRITAGMPKGSAFVETEPVEFRIEVSALDGFAEASYYALCDAIGRNPRFTLDEFKLYFRSVLSARVLQVSRSFGLQSFHCDVDRRTIRYPATLLPVLSGIGVLDLPELGLLMFPVLVNSEGKLVQNARELYEGLNVEDRLQDLLPRMRLHLMGHSDYTLITEGLPKAITGSMMMALSIQKDVLAGLRGDIPEVDRIIRGLIRRAVWSDALRAPFQYESLSQMVNYEIDYATAWVKVGDRR